MKAYYGAKTGLNEAFVINDSTRNVILAEDAKSAEVIRPYLRGQDIQRWSPEWANLWMIFTRRGINIDEYPGIKSHLMGFRNRLEPRPKDWSEGQWTGRKPGAYQWYETQDPVEYWQLFEKPKILYQDITWKPSFCLDTYGRLSNDTTFFLPSSNLWILASLNSPVSWWYAWRTVYHGKDEALRLKGIFMQEFPIPHPSDMQFSNCESITKRIIELTQIQQNTTRDVLDWLKVEHEIDDPTTKLQTPIPLDSDSLIAEVKKVRGKKKPLSLAALRSLRDEHARTIVPAQALAAEALGLERQISDLVNEAYGLTPDEVKLMWETAPPRMPIPGP